MLNLFVTPLVGGAGEWGGIWGVEWEAVGGGELCIGAT